MIDPQFFTSLRMKALLSQRGLAERAGVTLPVIRGVEEGHSQQLSLRVAALLASALGCSIQELLADERAALAESPADGDSDAMLAEDARRLEATLFAAGKLMHQRALGDVLGMTNVRLERAARHLESHASERGVALYRLNAQMGLRASLTVLSRKTLGAIDRHKVATDGLTTSQAQILYDIFRNPKSDLPRRAGEKRSALLAKAKILPEVGALVNARLAVMDRDSGLSLSPDVLCALEPGLKQSPR